MNKIKTSKQPMQAYDVVLTDPQTSAIDTFVRAKHLQLGDNFCDGMVAADATMAGILAVFENFIVTSHMISMSRQRQGIEIPKKNRFQFMHRRSRKHVTIMRRPATGKLSIVGR